ncbi:MAG: hypothetical protein WB760_03280 [Xanthobacteraceae bacterium]
MLQLRYRYSINLPHGHRSIGGGSDQGCQTEHSANAGVQQPRSPSASPQRSAPEMCDYSLHLVASRPAKVGDKLVATDFARSITRGFSAVGEPEVAVCLLPGTEIAFDEEVQYDRAFSLFGKARIEHKVARFRQVNMDDPHVHHDALEFPGGQIVMVTRLMPGQRATVLQLPASAREHGQPKEGVAHNERSIEPITQ